MSEEAPPSAEAEAAPADAGPRWLLFLREAYAPGLHLAFIVGWFLSLSGCLHRVRGATWRFDLSLVSAHLALFFLMYFIRVVDEVKDGDYDKAFNPDRPLARGAVSVADLKRYGVVTAALTLLFGVWPAIALSPWLLVILALDLAHTTFLLKLEEWSETVRENMLANLVVTYPVNAVCTVFIYLYTLRATDSAPRVEDLWIVLAYVFVFLHFELARKLVWPKVLQEGEQAYTRVLNPTFGALLMVLLAALPTGAILWILKPWAQGGLGGALTWTALLAPLMALFMAWRFFKKRDQRLKLKAFGMHVLTLFYVSLGVSAVASVELAAGW